jgi:hypothetical protein
MLEATHLITSIVASIITSLGILAGLWWFMRRGEKISRANISHKINFIKLDNKITYVGVSVIIDNVGRVAICPTVEQTNGSVVTIEELSPYLKNNQESQKNSPEYKLVFLGGRTFPANLSIEAGESQTIMFDFIIQNSTKSIKVYSYIVNGQSDEKDNSMGWNNTTVHEVIL